MDLLCYRQLHSPILCLGPRVPNPPSIEEFANLTIASCMSAFACDDGGLHMFQHPSGHTVEAREPDMQTALSGLFGHWPDGLRVGDVFRDVAHVMDDLKLLLRNGLVEIRCPDSRETVRPCDPLNRMEARGGHVTTPFHTREAVPVLRSEPSAELVS